MLIVFSTGNFPVVRVRLCLSTGLEICAGVSASMALAWGTSCLRSVVKSGLEDDATDGAGLEVAKFLPWSDWPGVELLGFDGGRV